MQTSTPLLTRRLLPLLLLLVACGCAPVQQIQVGRPSSPTTQVTPPSSPTTQVCTVPAPTDEGEPLATPEEITEELAALQQLGSWRRNKIEEGDPFVLDGAGPNAVPLVLNPQVQFYLDFFQGRFRCHFTKWLSRSTLYLPTIQQHFAQKGLPPELAALALIESGFNPVAYSSAKAAGLWQFIEGTGTRFGLRVDRHVDERRNPDKASRAAAAYLKALYDEFGHWYLAVAAYNAGEGKIRKAVERYGTRDFWELADQPYLALETKRYVPQLIAAIIILNDPAKYGFGDNDYQFPQPMDTMELPGGTSLTAISLSAGCSVEELQQLNRELRGRELPPSRDGYAIRLPSGTRALVAKNLPRTQRRIETEYVMHTVQSGQKIADICKQYDISTTTLLKANALRTASLKPGQRLRIPRNSERFVLPDSTKSATVLVQNAKKIVEPADSSSAVVAIQADRRKSKPQAGEIARNQVDKNQQPKAGKKEPASPVTVQAELRKTKIQADKAPKTPQPPPLKEQHYVVQRGDNLWKIAKKFQVSADELRRWNKLSDKDLKPGDRLVIRKA